MTMSSVTSKPDVPTAGRYLNGITAHMRQSSCACVFATVSMLSGLMFTDLYSLIFSYLTLVADRRWRCTWSCRLSILPDQVGVGCIAVVSLFYSNQPRNRDIRSLCRNRVHLPLQYWSLRKSPIVNTRQHEILDIRSVER